MAPHQQTAGSGRPLPLEDDTQSAVFPETDAKKYPAWQDQVNLQLVLSYSRPNEVSDMKLKTICAFVLLALVAPVGQADEDLYGVWSPVEYVIGDKVYPLRGLMIFTPNYFVANTTFDLDEDGVLEANANSGSLTVENGTLKLDQWMQLHWREHEPEGHFLRVDVPENIDYTIEGDQLIFHFPSGNRYISKRLQE